MPATPPGGGNAHTDFNGSPQTLPVSIRGEMCDTRVCGCVWSGSSGTLGALGQSGHLKASLTAGPLEVASRDRRKSDTQEETV